MNIHTAAESIKNGLPKFVSRFFGSAAQGKVAPVAEATVPPPIPEAKTPRPTVPHYILGLENIGTMIVETADSESGALVKMSLREALDKAAANGIRYMQYTDGLGMSDDSVFPYTNEKLATTLDHARDAAFLDPFPSGSEEGMLLMYGRQGWTYAPMNNVAQGPVEPAPLKL